MSRPRFLAAALLAALALPACTDEQDPIGLTPAAVIVPSPNAEPVVVMTRNLFLGAEIMSILEVSLEEVPMAATQAWMEVMATDFNARAELLADEIESVNPHLVGLNEVSLYRIDPTSDMLAFIGGVPQWIGPPVPNATVVAYDFAEILLAALEARGLDYRIAAKVTDHDLEVPAIAAMTQSGPLFMDIRYTDHDVILARSDVKTDNAFSRTYEYALPVPLGPVTMDLLRGWASVDARVGQSKFRFVATHLEVQEYPEMQQLQLAELMAWMDGYRGTIILAGDLNSAGNPSAPDRAKTMTYPLLLAAGFEDTWLGINDADDGVTCCQDPSLLNTASELDERLDLILIRRQGQKGLVGLYEAFTTGDDASVRTPDGLWASDHAGVAAMLRLVPPGLASK